MGFTRYWIRPTEFDAVAFREFAAECADACAEFEGSIADAAFDAYQVRFEGKPGCETFLIAQTSMGRERNGMVTEYCKTARLPYDAAVARCLELLKERFPEVTVPEPS